jgi:predicted nucleotidyltransferase
MPALSIFQARVLEHVAAFAARYPCVTALYIFGSVARGETASAEDVDLAPDFLPLDVMARDCADSFTAFQAEFKDWELASSELFARPFRFARSHFTDRDDEPWWVAVKEAGKSPVAVVGKAIMAATPRHKPKG